MNEILVLVIEDSLAIFNLIRMILTVRFSGEGYKWKVIHALDGTEGLRQVWRLSPDVVLLDIQLPKLNGYELLQSLRTGGNMTPVIMMTANTGLEEQRKAFEVGCNAYIAKPFAPSLLYAQICQQLRIKA